MRRTLPLMRASWSLMAQLFETIGRWVASHTLPVYGIYPYRVYVPITEDRMSATSTTYALAGMTCDNRASGSLAQCPDRVHDAIAVTPTRSSAT